MSDQQIETRLKINPENIRTAKIIEPRYSQFCMLCDNTREILSPMRYHYPWVCNECKEAITFLKDFIKQATVAKDACARMEEPHENIHPL